MEGIMMHYNLGVVPEWQWDIKKEEQMLDYAMQRKNASDQAIADAQATVDQFVSGAVSSGISSYIPG